MRRTTLARGGALLTAAALALSLNTGAATADSTQTEKVPAVKADLGNKVVAGESFGSSKRAGGDVVANATPGKANIISFSQYHVLLHQPGTYIFEGNPKIDWANSGLNRIRSRMYVGGTNQGFFDMSGGGIVLPSTVKSGKAQLGPSNLYYNGYPSTSDSTKSNWFNIRRYTKSTNTYGLVVNRSGSNISFKAQNWKIFKPSTGKYVAMNTIRLQYRSDGRWVTKKTITLNSNGTGSYSTKTNTKRSYRLYYPTTDSIYGARTTATGLI